MKGDGYDFAMSTLNINHWWEHKDKQIWLDIPKKKCGLIIGPNS